MYDVLSERIDRALKVIQGLDADNLSCGKYVVDDDFYYVVHEYQTQHPSEVRHEAHKKYVDIQYIVKGAEYIEVTASAFMTVDEPYHEETDMVFFKDPKQASKKILNAGEYMVLYPRDSHKPGICIDEPVMVKKIVGKVRIPNA